MLPQGLHDLPLGGRERRRVFGRVGRHGDFLVDYVRRVIDYTCSRLSSRKVGIVGLGRNVPRCLASLIADHAGAVAKRGVRFPLAARPVARLFWCSQLVFSTARGVSAVPPDLREGVLLEDTGERLAWMQQRSELQHVGAPEVAGSTLVWRDRVCLGGVRATIRYDAASGPAEGMRLVEVELPLDQGDTTAGAVDCFYRSVEMLEERLGSPGLIRRPPPPFGRDTFGSARWRFDRVLVGHTLIGGDPRPVNRTTVELLSLSWFDRFRAFTEKWLGRSPDPYGDLVGEGGKRAL